MPTELYGTLYGHDNLYIVMNMLKDIYTKRPQSAAAQGATAPFTIICFPTSNASKAPNEASLEERVAQLN